ncbi:MAG: hypothetical protein U9P07_10630 [Pseudomonadota bacterium]|nr:hypothetical protein [Pseudomonadota bacterium]
MALAHSRRPSMAGFRGVRRESHRVIRSAANTAMSQARTSRISLLPTKFYAKWSKYLFYHGGATNE